MKAIDRSEQCKRISPHTWSRPESRKRIGGRTIAPSTRASGPSLPAHRGGGDTSIVARRLTSEHFVGRRAELEEFEQALESASERHPEVILLGGDSGVGKTRLVGELERRLPERGVLVLRGESVEQDDGELPYAPLTSALRPLVRAGD